MYVLHHNKYIIVTGGLVRKTNGGAGKQLEYGQSRGYFYRVSLLPCCSDSVLSFGDPDLEPDPLPKDPVLDNREIRDGEDLP